MQKLIACCGLDCSKCPAFIATQNNDDNERARVAKVWAEKYNVEIKAEDINCDGCKTGGRKVSYCNVCAVKKCNSEKGVENCAYCDNYACEELQKIFELAHEAKETLDGIRQ